MFFRFRLPIAYHGRASSIVISGTDIIRPRLERKMVVQGFIKLFLPGKTILEDSKIECEQINK